MPVLVKMKFELSVLLDGGSAIDPVVMTFWYAEVASTSWSLQYMTYCCSTILTMVAHFGLAGSVL